MTRYTRLEAEPFDEVPFVDLWIRFFELAGDEREFRSGLPHRVTGRETRQHRQTVVVVEGPGRIEDIGNPDLRALQSSGAAGRGARDGDTGFKHADDLEGQPLQDDRLGERLADDPRVEPDRLPDDVGVGAQTTLPIPVGKQRDERAAGVVVGVLDEAAKPRAGAHQLQGPGRSLGNDGAMESVSRQHVL